MDERFDLVIENGLIYDGSGGEPIKGSVGIKDGRITALGEKLDSSGAGRVIDAQGHAVSPGFIDAHSHDDLTLIIRPDGKEKLLQGVTTTVTGNCGNSPAPVSEEHRDEWFTSHASLGVDKLVGDQAELTTFASFLDKLEKARPGLNTAALVGHSTIRTAVMGLEDRQAEPEELKRMKELVTEAVEAGAFGLSSGVFYAPGSYAGPEELIQLVAHLGQVGGKVYTAHIRNEREMVLSGMAEAVEAGSLGMVPTHISHHKVAGKSNWGRSEETIAMFRAWRDSGKQVTCDQYPYDASSTSLAALLPPHFLSGGPKAFQPKLKDPEERARLKAELTSDELTSWENMIKDADFERIIISDAPGRPDMVGRSVAEIAVEKGREPLDLVFDLVGEYAWGVGMINFGMSEEDIRAIMGQPFTAVGSDGIPWFEGAQVHPRLCGTFPRVLGRYVREQGVLPLAEALRKMTSLTAGIFGLEDRGWIKEGLAADLVIFDPTEIIDKADYKHPLAPPEGIDYVIVNGELAVEKGDLTGVRAGRVLRNTGKAGKKA